MAYVKLTILLMLLFLACPAHSAPALSREQALRWLTDMDVQMRRQAVTRLGEIGAMADTPALAGEWHELDE